MSVSYPVFMPNPDNCTRTTSQTNLVSCALFFSSRLPCQTPCPNIDEETPIGINTIPSCRRKHICLQVNRKIHRLLGSRVILAIRNKHVLTAFHLPGGRW